MTPARYGEALLEREAQLARASAALGGARAGHGALVVVEGPPGIGKTSVLAAVRADAEAHGMRVLRARGTELERDFAFGLVRQLFEPVLAESPAEVRSELLKEAAGGAARLFAAGGGGDASGHPLDPESDPSFPILHGLYWLLANLAAVQPLCLLVDDAHWADTPSLRYLAFVLTRLDELPVALVIATRPHEPGPNSRLLATVTGDASAHVIQLPPLTVPAVAELVEAAFGAAPDLPFVEACLRATRGTPFLLRELLAALVDEGAAPTADAAPHVERVGAASAGRSIRLRLDRLPEHAGRLARALAILEEGDLLQAGMLADLEPPDAAEAAELLAAAGIVEPDRPLRFVHPIVRNGVYAELTGAERARGHSLAARLLAEQPTTRDRVAQHLLVSQPSGDDWAVEQLLQAAESARGQGAPELGALYLRRALEEPPPPERQSELLLDLGVAEASAGLEGWIDHLRAAVDTAGGPTEAVRAARALARALNRAQRFSEAVDVLDRAAAALPSDRPELALELEAAAVVVGLHDTVVSPSMLARRRALRARAASDPSVRPDVLAAAACVSVLTNEPAENGAALALEAEAHSSMGADDGENGSSTDIFARTSLSLLWAERNVELLTLLDVSIARARAVGDSGLLAVGLLTRGWLAFRTGRLSAAEADARTALAATELPAPPMYRALNSMALALTLVEQGDLAGAEGVLAPLSAEAAHGSLVASTLHFARGALSVGEGAVRDGLEEFTAAGAVLARADLTCPSFLSWRSSAALAHLALGQNERAGLLAEQELELARSFGTPRAIGVAERAAGVVAGGDRGELLLRSAVESLDRGGAALERARALTDLGALLRRRNRRSEAKELLRDALDDAFRLGAGPLAQRAETELRATGARPRRIVLTGVESLTASERRIAEYAGQGLTNREIAQVLFITTRTVEGHLTSVFRKLRLESRTGLADALGAPSPISA